MLPQPFCIGRGRRCNCNMLSMWKKLLHANIRILKSPSRNKSDDSPFTMATSLYDIRLVLPFLQLVFQHSGNRDIKIFTMKPRRVMAIYHLYINLLPQYGHISDTIKIIQLLLENYPTQRLETILGGKTIRTMQTQYIQN